MVEGLVKKEGGAWSMSAPSLFVKSLVFPARDAFIERAGIPHPRTPAVKSGRRRNKRVGGPFSAGSGRVFPLAVKAGITATFFTAVCFPSFKRTIDTGGRARSRAAMLI
jgi:hypothetical protein